MRPTLTRPTLTRQALTHPTLTHVVRRLGCAVVLAAACVASTAPAASAAVPTPKRALPVVAKAFDSVAAGSAILAEAARYAGTPYRYGATGPDAFDCSGYTLTVFRHFGIELPRTSGMQSGATDPVAAPARQPGDLIFFHSGGRISHVGIYAGGNEMWASPRAGKSVMRQGIWSAQVSYGRVRKP